MNESVDEGSEAEIKPRSPIFHDKRKRRRKKVDCPLLVKKAFLGNPKPGFGTVFERLENNLTEVNAANNAKPSLSKNIEYDPYEMINCSNDTETNEEIKQYTTNFSIKKYLKLIPDPFKYFENPGRVCRYNVLAVEFLKNYFRFNKVSTIRKAYKSSEHPHHLSLAVRILLIEGLDRKTPRNKKENYIEDIKLLQEIAFIEHRDEIKEQMEKNKRNK